MRKVSGVAVMGCLLASSAMAGDLPWLNKQNSTPAAQSSGALPWENSAAKPVNTAPQMMQPAMEDPQTRELDDRKLNTLAEDYYAISSKSSVAVSQYTKLQKRVKDFRKALESRGYDAKDIIADVSKLEARIAAAKKKAQAVVTNAPAKADVKK